MTNWKAGMKAVCIRTHSMGTVKSGVVYTLRSIEYCPICGCINLDVGIDEAGVRTWACFDHHASLAGVWFGQILFRPLLGDEQRELDAIEEDVKETELIPA